MRRLLLIWTATALAVALVPAAGAEAAGLRCNHTRGKELARSAVVKVYKVKQSRTVFRYYGCARPSGLVAPLTKPFKANAVKLVASKAAYVAFTRTLSGQQTISVVDARTGRQRHGLYPPRIEFDTDPATPQIGRVRLNTKGELAVSYVGLGSGSSTDSTTYIYAFDQNGNEQLLDSGPSRTLPPSSVRLVNEAVSWTHAGTTHTVKLGEVSLTVTASKGTLTSGDVTTAPAGGLACHVAQQTLAGTCIGFYPPNTRVRVIATGAASSTVTISGACAAVHAPVAGQATSVATCEVDMSRARKVTVGFN